MKMKRLIISLLLVLGVSAVSYGQKFPPGIEALLEQSRRLLQEFDQDLPLDTAVKKTVVDTSLVLPHIIPVILPAELFIPTDRLNGYTPWDGAPIVRPTIHFIPVNGISGMVGVGEFSIEHPDKFFSTLSGQNVINIPGLFVSRQMMLGNTFRLGGNVYFMNGILYGAQMGVMGNNWGMGTREGFIWRPSSTFALMVWNQYFQSVSVYTPVVYPRPNGDMAAILMPATPEVFSFGVQASFVAGEFIIGIGTSISPVPFQKRHHSEFRYK
ncbi:MAG: hypothetical protein IKV05_07190 [Bacteroidales bacterium]|nr:hypothetical protein [Bacteroidales bacterium]